MAAQKKPSGLGKGLDELLEDNTPTIRQNPNQGKPLVETKGAPTEHKTFPLSSIYDMKPKSLYDTKPKTKSVKSNFKK